MVSPPAQGGTQILGNLAFLGVLVIMLDEFLQSMLAKSKVLSSSSTDWWIFQLVIALAMRSAQCAHDSSVPQVQFLGMVLTCPLLCNNRCRGRLCSRMLGKTVDTCSASRPGCVMDDFHTIST